MVTRATSTYYVSWMTGILSLVLGSTGFVLSAIQYATRDFGLRRYDVAGEFTFLPARASEAFFHPWVNHSFPAHCRLRFILCYPHYSTIKVFPIYIYIYVNSSSSFRSSYISCLNLEIK